MILFRWLHQVKGYNDKKMLFTTIVDVIDVEE